MAPYADSLTFFILSVTQNYVEGKHPLRLSPGRDRPIHSKDPVYSFLGLPSGPRSGRQKGSLGQRRVLEITIIPIDFRMIVGYDGVAPSRAITE